MSFTRIMGAGALIATLFACTPAPVVVPGDADAEEDGATPTNRVDIPATVRRNLGITFAEVVVRDVARTIRVPGAFELEPRARREYRMPLSGNLELLVDQYEQVEEGDVLFRYRSAALAELVGDVVAGDQLVDSARAGVDVARATLEEARRMEELARARLEVLSAAGVRRADLEAQAAEIGATLPRLESELVLARTSLLNAERTRDHSLRRAAIALGASSSELSVELPLGGEDGRTVPRYAVLDVVEVRAHGPGVVEGLHVTDGAFVEATESVLAVVDPTRLRFRALALQSDLDELAGAERARIVLPVTPAGPSVEGVPATLSLGLEASPAERTIAVVARPDHVAGWMRPGISAFLEVVTETTGRPALAVPRSAVVQDGLTHVLFRRDPKDPNKAIRVEADMGVDDGFWVELRSGVMRGDEVVLSGAYELRLATQQSGAFQKGGHFHADGSFHGEH